MKIILLQDVKGLGRKDEVKVAAAGYVLNFLLPKKLAVIATGKKIEKLKNKEINIGKQKEADRQKLINLAKKLDGQKLIIRGKASSGGKLFAGVGAKEIVEELKKQRKVEVQERNIRLKKHFKDLGEHEVMINFGEGILAKIRVKITAG